MGVSSEMRVSLELARELNGLKQSEAAQKIGVSTDTLGNYERGKENGMLFLRKRFRETGEKDGGCSGKIHRNRP